MTKLKIIMRVGIYIWAMVSLCPAQDVTEATPSNDPTRYNIVWETPGKNAFDSVPLGNGDIGINAWVQKDGDLQFYIGKTDSWGDNSRLLKVGRVNVKLSPNPFEKGNPYKQTLDLKNGELSVQAQFKDGTPMSMKVWVDANHPVIHVSVESKKKVQVTTSSDLWRTAPTTIEAEVGDPLWGTEIPTVVEPDMLLKNQKNRIGWYHHNKKSFGPDITMEKQGLEDFEYTNIILNRTFGVVIEATAGVSESDTTLNAPLANKHDISLYVLTTHPSTPEQWLSTMNQLIAKTKTTPLEQRYQQHKAWWHSFWNRSWIHLEAKEQTAIAILQPNALPLALGQDQNGTNRFLGAMDRVSVIRRVLSKDEIEGLASDQHKKLPEKETESWDKVQSGTYGKKVSFDGELTLEAWVKPDNTRSMRIIDKITPGLFDGFLLDLQEGKVRFINGRSTIWSDAPLVAGKWQHVAVTVRTHEKINVAYRLI